MGQGGHYLIIRLPARVFYERSCIVNVQPRWLSLVENEGE